MTVFSSSPTLKIEAGKQTTKSTDSTIFVSVERSADAYSRYAHTGNAAQTGRALDTLAAQAPKSMEPLFAALDFSEKDGSDIARALPLLSGEDYGTAALATLDMQRMLNDLVLEGGRPYEKTAENLTYYVQPYAGAINQTGHMGYDAWNAGMIGGLGRQNRDGSGWGSHLVFNHLSMNGDTNGKLESDSFMLGAHLNYTPSGDGFKWQILCRAGVDQMEMKRKVYFAGYDARNKSDWTGFSGMTSLRGWYEKDLGSVTWGPLATLDYGIAERPAVTEDGNPASRLHADSECYQSIRSRVGFQVQMKPQSIGQQTSWLAQGAVTWNHEYMNRIGTTTLSFAEARGVEWNSRAKYPGRDSVGLEGGILLNLNEKVSVSAKGGSELYMQGDSALHGNVSVKWTF